MQYALLIYTLPGAQDHQTDVERKAVTAEYYGLYDDSRVVSGAHLAPVTTATTLRLAGDEPLTTDGPFADTKEVFAGFFMVEADDIDGALEIAARIPAARMGGAIEIRPLVHPPQ